jgi:hypothetical protein
MASLEVLPLASRGISNDNGMFLSQVKERDRKRYFRVDDDGKANMTAPAEAATWFRLVSVSLENDVAHPGALGDEIGVATRWQLPGVFAGNPPDALARVQAKIDSADWGYDPRSGDWAGKAIAAALDLDLSDEVQKERCKGMLEAWIAAKALKVLPRTASRLCGEAAQDKAKAETIYENAIARANGLRAAIDALNETKPAGQTR